MIERLRLTDAAVTVAILTGGAARRMGGADQPLCAIYAARCADVVHRRIERGLLKAASLAEDVRVEEIGPEELATYDPDGLMFVNVNTPHDYERAKNLMDRMLGSDAAIADRITDALPWPSAAARRRLATT